MDDYQENLGYVQSRILIEHDRVLTPTLPGCTIVLTGGQVEMLRNVAHYLSRRSTFVEKYNPITYTTPDDENWENILSIVADLEENLMGNENTIFGVKERWSENLGETKSGDGAFSKLSTVVPSGYIYVAQLITVTNFTRAGGTSFILVADGTTSFYAEHISPLPIYKPLTHDKELVLMAGDWVQVVINGCINGDDIRAGVWGYKMLV